MAKNKKEIGNIKLIFLLVFSFVIGGVVTFALLKWTPLINDVLGSSDNNTVVTKNKTQVYEKTSLKAAIDKIYDAVVLVQIYNDDQLKSTGSGFVYKVDNKYGYILTNEHVVSDAKTIKVVMSNDEETEAETLGSDEYLDLAVLRIDKDKVKQVANIGKSEDISLGDTIFAVGAPMGYDYRGSVTSGILSGKDRMVTVSVGNSTSSDWVMRVLQIDAPLNPGNSGGPLLNINGEVIGVCSMKLVDSQIEGMGFAIPIEYAMNHVDSLENGKEIEWPVLGITMLNTTDTMNLYRNQIILDKNVDNGVVIIECQKGSAAADSELKKGDVIVKIDDNKVKNIAYLRYELYQHQAGDTIEITYIRDGKEHTTKVKLGKSS